MGSPTPVPIPEICPFLFLPRELRDQIYAQVLLSSFPDHLVGAHTLPTTVRSTRPRPLIFQYESTKTHISTNPSRSDKSKIPLQRYKLCVPTSSTVTPKPKVSYPRHTYPAQFITLSLLRVCRQVHHETRNLFWSNTTFYFPSSSLSLPISPTSRAKTTNAACITDHPSPKKLLKSMGQTSSRLITNIRLDIPPLSLSFTSLPHIFQLLRSRARYGAFKRLELHWGAFEFADLDRAQKIGPSSMYGLHSRAGHIPRLYETLIADLRIGCEEAKFEVIIKVDPSLVDTVGYMGIGSEIRALGWEDTAKELHWAVGGKLFCERELIWDNYVRVGEEDKNQDGGLILGKGNPLWELRTGGEDSG